MLTLTRRSGERIQITTPDGTEIWIRVTETRPNKCRLSVDAPAGVRVLREELVAEWIQVPTDGLSSSSTGAS